MIADNIVWIWFVLLAEHYTPCASARKKNIGILQSPGFQQKKRRPNRDFNSRMGITRMSTIMGPEMLSVIDLEEKLRGFRRWPAS